MGVVQRQQQMDDEESLVESSTETEPPSMGVGMKNISRQLPLHCLYPAVNI